MSHERDHLLEAEIKFSHDLTMLDSIPERQYSDHLANLVSVTQASIPNLGLRPTQELDFITFINWMLEHNKHAHPSTRYLDAPRLPFSSQTISRARTSNPPTKPLPLTLSTSGIVADMAKKFEDSNIFEWRLTHPLRRKEALQILAMTYSSRVEKERWEDSRRAAFATLFDRMWFSHDVKLRGSSGDSVDIDRLCIFNPARERSDEVKDSRGEYVKIVKEVVVLDDD